MAAFLNGLFGNGLSGTGHVPERPLPKKAVETAANKKEPYLIPPNAMIGQFTAVLGTAVLGTAFLG